MQSYIIDTNHENGGTQQELNNYQYMDNYEYMDNLAVYSGNKYYELMLISEIMAILVSLLCCICVGFVVCAILGFLMRFFCFGNDSKHTESDENARCELV